MNGSRIENTFAPLFPKDLGKTPERISENRVNFHPHSHGHTDDCSGNQDNISYPRVYDSNEIVRQSLQSAHYKAFLGELCATDIHY